MVFEGNSISEIGQSIALFITGWRTWLRSNVVDPINISFGSGSRQLIYYGSDRIWFLPGLFVAIEKYVVKYGRYT